MSESSFDPRAADLSLAALFAGWAMADEIARRLAAAGYDDIRFADGVVFQHLVAAAMPITALAARLGVTQQAASKTVADLERRGYVERTPDPRDARARIVRLTARGEAVVAAGREQRAEVVEELVERVGRGRAEAARRLLVDVIEALGADETIRRRRVRPPR
jgi:DNA-binding MarR family transcriptional regulator